jgi:hypothetical protein
MCHFQKTVSAVEKWISAAYVPMQCAGGPLGASIRPAEYGAGPWARVPQEVDVAPFAVQLPVCRYLPARAADVLSSVKHDRTSGNQTSAGMQTLPSLSLPSTRNHNERLSSLVVGLDEGIDVFSQLLDRGA